MRPLEILLLLTLLGGVVAGAVPGFRATWPARRVPLAAALAVALQLLVEGPRWQMAPAYALALTMILVSRRGSTGERAGWRGWMGDGALTGLFALALAVSGALPLAFPVPRLPPPTGPYDVGTLTYHWLDTGRPETFTADPDDRRELMVQVWYPAQVSPSAKRATYLEDGAALAPLARLLRLPGFVFGHLKYIRTNAVAGAPMAPGGARFPVLIFAHGRGGFRQHNSFQVEELVSHGYVVAAMDQPYAAAGVDFPDGRRLSLDPRMLDRDFIDSVIPFLARDASFTLDRLADIDGADPKNVLTGRLDLQRAGMFGVSLGGMVTAQACLRDPRLKACLPMDVYMPIDVAREGLEQPTMWISREAATMRQERWDEGYIDRTQGTMRSVFERLPGDGYLVLVPGMFHQNISDFPYLVRQPLDVWLGLDGPIDPYRAHAIIDAYSLAFFDHHLKGAPAPLLDGPSARFPEVIFARR